MSSDPTVTHDKDGISDAKAKPPAYAVLYDKVGTFLIATKRTKAYYYLSENGETVNYNGIDLTQKKGGGLNALPGGRNDENDTEKCARREFLEETGINLPPSAVSTRTIIRSFEGNSYSAAYFLADVGDVASTYSTISSYSFPNSNKIVAQIIKEKYTKRAQVMDYVNRENISPWPMDNELDAVACWNIKNENQWKTIQKWKGNQAIGWYYEILKYMRVDIFDLSA
ncbi:NUDIX hydrolase [Burkholderia sp. Ac-20344]|uniref:NUDIX hydrolase n=1 Tax=Burkholderia sp. Ac-20344 TaxID=2703890 RepID=UPI00197B4E12|nr:NUDIX hydrolase [Burkholderia sp. Ac-20344]MBN3835045.1 NUDIX hydrolase [Burkholderia sp. Ac-20344]